MKEDAQLICPVSFEDPNELWQKIQRQLSDRLPLRDVTWKSPISSSYITIDKLPLRFLPAGANLFKDTQHAFRWFLAPYVYIYFVSAETLDAYKACKTIIKKNPWLIVYVPFGNHTIDVYNKIYARIAGDFYNERSGDRSAMLILSLETPLAFGVKNTAISTNPNTLSINQQSNNSFSELMSKLREGIVMSFQQRSAIYDTEIRRLDGFRGSVEFEKEFKNLFLVKESMALMYQMMQLPDKALGQYEELEAILAYAPTGALPNTDWPMVAPEPLKQADVNRIMNRPPSSANNSNSNNPPDTPADDAAAKSSAATADSMSDAYKNGEDVVAYSINLARMRILQQQMSALEVHRYIYARQMYFLLTHLDRPLICAEKSLHYVTTSYEQITRKLKEKYSMKAASSSSAQDTTPRSPSTLQGTTESESTASAPEVSYEMRRNQANLWVLTASMKIIRVCRDMTFRLLNAEKGSADSMLGSTQSSPSNVLSSSSGATAGQDNMSSVQSISALMSASEAQARAQYSSSHQHASHYSFSSTDMAKAASINTIEGTQLLLLRDATKILSELMQFAVSILQVLVPMVRSGKSLSMELAESMVQWNASEDVVVISNYDTAEYEHFLSHLEKELEIAQLDDVAYAALLLLVAISQKLKKISSLLAALHAEEGEARPEGTHSIQETLKIQEISLAVMILKQHWNLLHFADRPRFALTAKMCCADILMCSGLDKRAMSLYENMLTYDCIAAHSSAVAINTFGKMETIVHGWTELQYWVLRKLLYCAHRNRDRLRYRWIASKLLLLSESNEALKSCLFTDIVNISTNAGVIIEGTDASGRTGLIHTPATPYELPLLSHFEFTIKANTASAPGQPEQVAQEVKGFQLIQEEYYPVSAYQFVAGQDSYSIQMTLLSKLPMALEVEKIAVIYKLITADNIIIKDMGSGAAAATGGGAPQMRSLDTPRSMRKASSFLSATSSMNDMRTSIYDSTKTLPANEEEFACILKGHREEEKIQILPGAQMLEFAFSPPAVGDYRVDRVAIVIAEGKISFYDKILTSQTLPAAGESTMSLGIASRENSAVKYASPSAGAVAGHQQESAYYYDVVSHHLQLQEYFDRHRLLKITAPEDMILLQASTPAFTPLCQEDRASVRVETNALDVVEELSISISQEGTMSRLFASSDAKLASGADTGSSMKVNSASSKSFFDSPSRRQLPLLTIDENQPLAVSIGAISQWVIESANDELQMEPEVPSSLLTASERRIQYRAFKGHQILTLSVPFVANFNEKSAQHTADMHCSLINEASLNVTCSGFILRNRCRIPFDVSTVCQLRCNAAICTTLLKIRPVPVIKPAKPFVAIQTMIRNISTSSLRLVGLSVLDTATKDNSGGGTGKTAIVVSKTAVAYPPPDLAYVTHKTLEKAALLAAQGVLLHSGLHYNCAIQLNIAELRVASIPSGRFILRIHFRRTGGECDLNGASLNEDSNDGRLYAHDISIITN